LNDFGLLILDFGLKNKKIMGRNKIRFNQRK